MLTLSLNGQSVSITAAATLADLLEQQEYQAQKIAIAVNGEFVPRSLYAETLVSDGDQIDVIQAVGGG